MGGGLIFGGAYTWRVLFSESYGIECRVEKRNFSSTEQRELRWGDVVINKDIDSKEYLEYFERQTKARTGEFFYKSDSYIRSRVNGKSQMHVSKCSTITSMS